GIARNFMESAAMVPGSIGGSARLYFPPVAFAGFSQYLLLLLFVCSRSLAIFGLPGNHHALCQWDRPTGRTIEILASLAGAWNCPAAGWRTVLPHLAAKPDVYQRRNGFIGRLLPVIPPAGWHTITLVTSCTRPTGFRRQWTCLTKPCKLSLPRLTIVWATPWSKQDELQRQ